MFDSHPPTHCRAVLQFTLFFLLALATATAQEALLFRAAGKGAEALLQTDRGKWPLYPLKTKESWLLDLPAGKEFDASGLLLLTNGTLLTLSDRGPTLYSIQFTSGSNSAKLVALPNCFTPAQLKPYAREKFRYYDSEGIAGDDQGRLYICEEANRWIMRCDPAAEKVERLDIDWTPVKKYFSADRNASFEGIAINGDRLYVANERNSPVIIVVDLNSLKVIDHFQVFPQTPSFLGTHYSDLCWHAGSLWVLCRQHRVIIEVDPQSHKILSEYDYSAIEEDLGYQTRLPVGIMEGLAVTDKVFWLVTDNNGLPRKTALDDIRPTLLRIPRPKAQPPAQ
jgi:uncharacterized protein YjiK